MKRSILILIIVLGLITTVVALDFNPSGNVNLRNRWNITSGVYGNFTKELWVNESKLTTVIGNHSAYLSITNTSYANPLINNVWAANQSFNNNYAINMSGAYMLYDGTKLIIKVT